MAKFTFDKDKHYHTSFCQTIELSPQEALELISTLANQLNNKHFGYSVDMAPMAGDQKEPVAIQRLRVYINHTK